MSVNSAPLLLGDDGYNISRSVRLRSSATAYFNRTFGAPTNQIAWTYSHWFKRGALGAMPLFGQGTVAGNGVNFTFQADDTIEFFYPNTGSVLDLKTTQAFRDPSAWYHLVVVYDSAQATSTNRVKMYVNGALITSYSIAGFPAQNAGLNFNTNGGVVRIGSNPIFGGNFDGLMAETFFIDGQALDASYFGATDPVTGVWKAKKYAGTYGANGFWLDFRNPSNTSSLGQDSAYIDGLKAQNNFWTTNNISVTAGVTYDSMIDVPTMYADGGNGRGNYATLNPLGKASTAVLADGNLALSNSGSTTYPAASAGIYPASGSWYFEATFTGSGTQECCVGMSNLTTFASQTFQTAAGNVYWNSNNGIYKDGAVFTGGAGKTFTYGDVIGVAYDIAAGTVTFYKNGVFQTPVVTGVGASYAPTLGFNYYTAGVLTANFGQRPFAYTPPTGFLALNTQNLPDATIKAGNKYFDATTYTGNGTSQSVVNSGAMQPDLVWVKSRGTTDAHWLVNSVTGASQGLISNSTSAEQNIALVTAFNTNGFAVNNPSNGTTNGSAYSLVGWQWKKGAAQGFDIVTYTGTGVAQNINHSLGVAPKMMIIKNRTSAVDWLVYHASLGNTNYAVLDTTAAAATNAAAWNNTSPTSSVFTVGTGTSVNQNTNSHVAYLFAEVAGFSKFGSYTGNGSSDGPFVYLGFRPKFVMVKRTDAVGNWIMWDTSRNQYNATDLILYPNLSNAEGSGVPLDALSNGFKMRDTSTSDNASGGTYIFAAFAENPFKNSLAR